MKAWALIVGGVIAVMCGLWGGAYAMHALEEWARFPALMSGLLVSMVGAGMVLSGAAKAGLEL